MSSESKDVYETTTSIDVRIIPCLQDNYAYLILSGDGKFAAVVDGVEPEKVVAQLKTTKAALLYVLTTHKHMDHAGGNTGLAERFRDVIIVGGEGDEVPKANKEVKEGDELKLGDLTITVMQTPCHTKGHVCYVVRDNKNAPCLFSGDTLFNGGCGRFFEGTAVDMHNNLNKKIAALPANTRVYGGHEYTVNNLKFACEVDPDNSAVTAKLKWAQARREAGLPTMATTLEEEQQYNPYLRCHTRLPAHSHPSFLILLSRRVHTDAVAKYTGKSASDLVQVMAELRRKKDSWGLGAGTSTATTTAKPASTSTSTTTSSSGAKL